MKTKLAALTLSTALVAAAAPAFAQSKGDMTIGLGIGWVNPTDSSSMTLAGPLKADDDIKPTFTFEYFIADNIGIEVLAAAPFEHKVSLGGVGNVVKTMQLPPTVSIQYHFQTGTSVTPFAGIGLNYTHFWDDKGVGALAGVPVSLDDSWGVALHAGVDVAVSDKASIRADVRWIDINTDVKVAGTKIGSVDVDPLVLGLSYVWKF